MLRWSRSSCMLCGHSSVDLVTETFRSTPTLHVTLQKLCSAVPAIHKFDVNRVFEETTSREGSLFCLPCLSALHGGMSVVSQIISLEQRLKNFAGCVGRKLSYLEGTVGHGSDHQRMEGDRFIGRKISQSSVSPEPKCAEQETSPEDPVERTEECRSTDTDTEESLQQPRTKQRKLSKGRVVTSGRKVITTPSTALPVSPSTTKSDFPLPSKTARIPGVENCPECDFFVDLRTPAQAKSSTQPVPHKTLETWRKSTRQKIAIHYRDNHMPPDAKPNFQRTKDGSNLFLCPQCPHTSVQSCKLAVHYLSIHVLENKTAPSKLSCPTEGCSFSVDIPVRRGVFTFQPPQRHVREALAVHVIKEHDIPSSAVLTIQQSVRKLYNNTTPLYVETLNNGKEYRCTRCDHSKRLPEKLDKN